MWLKSCKGVWEWGCLHVCTSMCILFIRSTEPRESVLTLLLYASSAVIGRGGEGLDSSSNTLLWEKEGSRPEENEDGQEITQQSLWHRSTYTIDNLPTLHARAEPTIPPPMTTRSYTSLPTEELHSLLPAGRKRGAPSRCRDPTTAMQTLIHSVYLGLERKHDIIRACSLHSILQ